MGLGYLIDNLSFLLIARKSGWILKLCIQSDKIWVEKEAEYFWWETYNLLVSLIATRMGLEPSISGTLVTLITFLFQFNWSEFEKFFGKHVDYPTNRFKFIDLLCVNCAYIRSIQWIMAVNFVNHLLDWSNKVLHSLNTHFQVKWA